MTTSSLLSPSDQAPPRSLVLSGGGVRISYQAGVLLALEEEGLTFNHVDGTSGGSLNTAMLLSGLDAEALCSRWRSLDPYDFASVGSIKDLLEQDECTAVGSARGVRENVIPSLGISFDRIRRQNEVQGTFNVLNYTRKVPEVVEHERIHEDYLVAGMSLPGVMPPVDIEGQLYIDPAFVLDANIMEAVRRGAREVWLVWVLGNSSRYRGGLFRLYVQMLEMSANGNLNDQFERLNEVNQTLKHDMNSKDSREDPIRLHVIRPDRPLPLDPALYTGDVTPSELIDKGYADARSYLEDMNPEGVRPEPETLMMDTRKLGIAFSETLTGPFATGVTEPEEGKKRGKQQGEELTIHVRIEINDLDQFEQDREHTARLAGHVDFPPLGTNIPLTRGQFNIFSTEEKDDVEKMFRYDLFFTHEGTPYHLVGKKRIQNAGGNTWFEYLSRWIPFLGHNVFEDLTTLRTTLYRGSGDQKEVAGAGVLKLDTEGLVDLVSSFHVTGADSAGERLEATGRFGRFLLGGLWDHYSSYAEPSRES